MIRIAKQQLVVQREPLRAPFGFKGAYLSELWQSVVRLEDDEGASGLGLGVQSILWSDADVFVRCGEERGNELMHELTRHALQLAEGGAYPTPIELIDSLIAPVYQYGQKITEKPELRLTFALNAMVAIDHAAWQLYSRVLQQPAFAKLIPETYRDALSFRHEALASIPLIPYGMSEQEMADLLEQGYFLIKVKMGADPDQDGDQSKMLAWDMQRLSQVHRIASTYSSVYTDSGRIVYYLDANGRYGSKDTLLRLLDHADRIGALEHILLFEEPFDEASHIDVSDVPVMLAADESVHSVEDAAMRMDMGYKAMALKPIAKTMSLSLQVAKLAHERGVACFCADLTVNPMMADWNKNLAGCIAPLPGLKVGAIETNGHQNYANWQQMQTYHPRYGAAWMTSTDGIYRLNEQFYHCSGGALDSSVHYQSLFGGA